MNEKEKLLLSVRQYHAVHKADIEIGDITVLAGINASGKSTLAHLFHAIVNSGANYDLLAQRYAFHQAEKLLNALSNLMRRIRMFVMRSRRGGAALDDALSLSSSMWRLVEEPGEDMASRLNRLSSHVSHMMDLAVKYADKGSLDRYLEVFSVEMELKNKLAPEDIESFVQSEIERIQSLYGKAIVSRTCKTLRYSNGELPRWIRPEGVVTLTEGKTTILSWDGSGSYIGSVGELLSVSKAIYVESPWRSIPTPQKNGYLAVQDGLMIPPPESPFLPDRSLFDVLQGSVSSIDEDSSSSSEGGDIWRYDRKDGQRFNLSDCATGIKSFSILSILYQRGLLDNNTLLIVDEPEAHLHPQWIFEYAKVLVRLNKQLGVRILVTTHSPDMLNALKRVADVDEVKDLNFYLANETTEGSFVYAYEPLKRDVEKIFAKFNYAMDVADLYNGEQS